MTRALSMLLLAVSCQAQEVELAIDAGPGFDFADASPLSPDAGPNPGCAAGAAECNNCVDDDGDGKADGFDPHCTSALDNDEGSFATGIPGDNQDGVKQDCFYDGDSGGGNDGCDVHVCCLLDLGGGPCPDNLRPNQYDPAACESSTACQQNCGPLTPPGCDCFGCCTVCNATDCVDVLINPAVAPDCDVGVVTDPARCPPCVRRPDCTTPCDPTGCTLCPGQEPNDVPPECEQRECPTGSSICATNVDCLDGEFCLTGCCIKTVE